MPAFSGLNVLFAPSPSELWVFCLWTGDHGTGLLDKGRRYYEMTYRATPHAVVVGSEPFDGEGARWTTLGSGRYLHAVREHGRVEVTVARIPIPEALVLLPAPA